MSKQNFRTVFLSDIHLGTTACNVDLLDKFLSSFNCNTLYLVGDILDFWQLSKRSSYFPQSHVNIVRKILSKAKRNTQINYVIGNHDDVFRHYNDLVHSIGNIHLENEFLFTALNGKRYLVTHGDLYDQVVLHNKWLAHLGDTLYQLAIESNTLLNWVRRRLGLPYWSLANFLKSRVKDALEFIYAFEHSVIKEAASRDLDGAICGHIHSSADKNIAGLHYLNCGDVCESGTAIIEHYDGRIEVIKIQDYLNERRANTEQPNAD